VSEINNEAALESSLQQIELPVEEGSVVLSRGELLDTEDNDRDNQRWAEIRVYGYYDPDNCYRYLIHTIGHSVRYHDPSASCASGITVQAQGFPGLSPDITADYRDLEPCEDCHPDEWHTVSPDTWYRVEVTWYRYAKCADAGELLDGLRREPKCKTCFHRPHDSRRCRCGCENYQEAYRALSVPGRKLAERLKKKDPAVARAMTGTIRL
jgi:hypothetical protein